MVKAGSKRAPPPRPPRVTRVWDRLDIHLPDRAIERDLRAIQQKVLVSGGGYGSSLHSSQDTEPSHDSGASGSLAHAGGRPAPLAAARSHLGAAVPHHTSAHLGYPPPAMDEQQGQGGGASQQWRSRSSSPSFEFAPASAPAPAPTGAPFGRPPLPPPAGRAVQAPQPVELGQHSLASAAAAAPAATSLRVPAAAAAGVGVGWDGFSLQVQQAAVVQRPSAVAFT